MRCYSCNSENPDGKRFCGDCGVALDPQAHEVTLQVEKQVEKLLCGRFKDRALIEYEVSDRIIGRMTTYAKILSWVFTPLFLMVTVIVGVLAFLGIKTYSDFTAKVDDVSKLATAKVDDASKLALSNLQKEAMDEQNSILDESNKAKIAFGQLELDAKKMHERLIAASQGAAGDEEKLAKLNAVRSANPDTTLGALNPDIFKPSPGSIDISSLSPSFPNAPPSALFGSSYRAGSTGPDIAKIQERLKELGCYDHEPTGIFDKATEDAVKDFKHAATMVSTILGLPQPEITGEVDYATWLSLFDRSPLASNDIKCK